MRYIVIGDDLTHGAIVDTEEYDDRDEAIAAAEMGWHHLTSYERKRYDAFYVLESINPGEDAEDHFDGDIIWRAK